MADNTNSEDKDGVKMKDDQAAALVAVSYTHLRAHET